MESTVTLEAVDYHVFFYFWNMSKIYIMRISEKSQRIFTRFLIFLFFYFLFLEDQRKVKYLAYTI